MSCEILGGLGGEEGVRDVWGRLDVEGICWGFGLEWIE